MYKRKNITKDKSTKDYNTKEKNKEFTKDKNTKALKDANDNFLKLQMKDLLQNNEKPKEKSTYKINAAGSF